MGLFRSATLFLLSAMLLPAQHSSAGDTLAGQALFQKSCTSCHGENGKGGRGPDLTTGQWRWGGSDDAILRNITQGLPGTQMPAFPMSPSDGEKLVAYLRSLSRSGPEEVLRGDPAAGRRTFFG